MISSVRSRPLRCSRHLHYKDLRTKIEAGEIKELEPAAISTRRSALQNEFLRIVSATSVAMRSKEIIAEARKQEEFRGQIDRNPTHAYNVLTKLVRRGDLIKTGMLYTAPGGNEATVTP